MINFTQLLPMFMQFRQNPGAFLASQGLNIPQQYMQSPEMAAKYLMQTRGMSQEQINNLMQTASQFQGYVGSGNQNGGK